MINLVSRAGFEPATCPLGGGRAIQLRHRDFFSTASLPLTLINNNEWRGLLVNLSIVYPTIPFFKKILVSAYPEKMRLFVTIILMFINISPWLKLLNYLNLKVKEILSFALWIICSPLFIWIFITKFEMRASGSI